MAAITVVIVNDYASVNGGAAKVAIESAIGLANAGWIVYFFSAVGPVDPRLISAGVEVVLTHQADLSSQSVLQGVTVGLWNKDAARRISTLLNTFPKWKTVIHLHGWVKALTGSVVRSSLDSGHPVTMTLHDYFLACPNGGFFNFQSQKQCPLKPLSAACIGTQCDKRGYHQKLWRVARHIGNEHAGIPGDLLNFIAVSNYSLELMSSYLPTQARVELVRNPITKLQMSRVTPSQSRAILYVGRLDPEKGVTLLAKVAKDVGMPVRFVGTGPEEDHIRAANPNATFSGWCSQEMVIEEIRNARALVLPSLWHETQGMVVAEAAAHGVPSIVPDKCAASEMVMDRKNGMLFRTGEFESLRTALIELNEDVVADRLGLSAYDSFWADPPTLDRHVESLMKHYSTMLGESNTQSLFVRDSLVNREEESPQAG